jgi:hypothetical protein
MSKIVKFGEDAEGYNIPVLNEREIRASAGILFLLFFISFMLVIFKWNFILIKYVITVFLTDFIIRVAVNPKFSPTLIIGRLIVSNQLPEYVGAPQKKFAWKIGIALSSIMFILLVVINAFSPITSIICIICLLFLFLESAFGICLGCKCYSKVYKEKTQYCPGEICDIKSRHPIQKTSRVQIFIVFGLLLYIVLIVAFFNNLYIKKPYDLFGIFSTSIQSK